MKSIERNHSALAVHETDLSGGINLGQNCPTQEVWPANRTDAVALGKLEKREPAVAEIQAS